MRTISEGVGAKSGGLGWRARLFAGCPGRLEASETMVESLSRIFLGKKSPKTTRAGVGWSRQSSARPPHPRHRAMGHM